MKKLFALLLVVMLLAGSCLAEGADRGKYAEPITITTARTMNETVVFDENDPLKKNYQENLWTNTFLEYLNIDLDYDWIATDDDSNMSKWAAAIATGNVPDFAIVDEKIYKLLLDAELVADCTEIYSEYASEQYKALLPEAALEQLTFDGKLMGLPWPTKGYHGASLLFVRQDWLDKVGMSYPTNYEEIVAVAKAFKEAKLGGEETIGMMFGWDTSDGDLKGLMNMFGAYYDYWINVDGKLAYSNIQPEMKDALLALQELYAAGLINQDFAVTTADLAKEYIAGGKTGIFFATSWNTTTSMQALHDNDPEAVIASSIIFGKDGEPVQFQTNTPTTGKIFVSNECENPEAVMKMLNLSAELTLDPEAYVTYCTDESGFLWSKYLPFTDVPRSTLNDLVNSYEIEQAYQQGITDIHGYDWTNPDNPNRYGNYLKAKNGEGAWWYTTTYGVDGTYTKLYYAFQDGLQLPDGYLGLSTETQDLMGDVINDALNTAMIEVIMGADISVYEAACEAWLANGGATITEEINEASGL